jgi:hypothetical protein
LGDSIAAVGNDDVDGQRRKLGRHRWQAGEISSRQPVFDRNVATLDIAELAQPLPQSGEYPRVGPLCRRQDADADELFWLLRAADPRRDCGGSERDQYVAAAHSMTSSARARMDCGTVSPSAFAVLRLTTNSNLVGSWTGKSRGFSPRRILST